MLHIYNKNNYKMGEFYMENVFDIKYNTKLDRLETSKKKNRFLKFIKKNKLISIICVSFLSLSILNFYLIYSFIKILEKI